ncbi:MAG: phage tail tape measure protein, partial [Porticoccaceae bacterium]
MAKKKLTYVFGADLSELERAWKRIDRSMNKLSAQFKKVGSTMTKTFTVPLVAMGAAATKAALDIDDAMDAIASGTGATGRALKSLQDDWKKLAGSVTHGFDVSAKVLADYNTRLGLTGKSLTDISQKALDAARLLGEDVSNVVSQSAKAMRDWAVPAEEMGKFMDVLFKASQSTGIGMGTLSTQLYKYGAALRGMGFDLESSIALLAQFEQQGVNTERIMGSLSMGLGRMAREGITDAGEAFRLLVEEIKNAENTTEATRLAIEVFGSRAGPDMALAIREGRFSVEQLIATLRDAEGAIQQTTKATDGFAEQWARTKNRVMLAIEPLGKEILNIAESVIPKVENSIASAATAIGNASDDTKKKILALAGTLAAGGPLLLAISATINALSTLGGAFIALAAGPAAPIVIATAGVLALVAALHELKKAQESIRPPEEVLSRAELSEQAAEIFHARHGKYPLTAKDYEEIDRIIDELIAESVRHKARAIKEAPAPAVPPAVPPAVTPAVPPAAPAIATAAAPTTTPSPIIPAVETARERLAGEIRYAETVQRLAEMA